MSPGDLVYYIENSWSAELAKRVDCIIISHRGVTPRGTNMWNVLRADNSEFGLLHEDSLRKVEEESQDEKG